VCVDICETVRTILQVVEAVDLPVVQFGVGDSLFLVGILTHFHSQKAKRELAGIGLLDIASASVHSSVHTLALCCIFLGSRVTHDGADVRVNLVRRNKVVGTAVLLYEALVIKLPEQLDGTVWILVDRALFIRTPPAFIERDGGVLGTRQSPAT
jgi:hypothetical protein